tara:strand:- start:6569 stop:7636 length:1068 start_codon:yes stop_codon:yes gene_type:complete
MSDPIEKKNHLQRINMPSLVEGEVLKKTHITNVFDNTEFENAADLDSVKASIRANQIREEGLDPININDIKEVTAFRPKPGVRTNRSVIIPISPQWTAVEKASGFNNSDHPNQAVLNIDWDPEKHTHIVIRCSGSLSTDTTQPGGGPLFLDNFDTLNRIYQVGLQISGPRFGVVSVDEAEQTGFFLEGSPIEIWPYQTVRLNPAFSNLGTTGFLPSPIASHFDNVRGLFEDGRPKSDEDFQDDVMSARASRGAKFVGDKSALAESYVPKGTWEEFLYDRRSGLNQSFNLIAHGSSKNDRTTGDPISSNSFYFNRSGVISIKFMMRVSGKPDSYTRSETHYPRLSTLFLSATVYGR